MNFFINSTRKNTGKDQSQSKGSHRAAVGGMNHILVGLLPCGEFNGPWGFRQVKQWTGKSHAKSSAWWSNIQNNRTEVLKAISGQGLAGPKRFQIVDSACHPFMGQIGTFKPIERFRPEVPGFVQRLVAP
ncbi:MAG: hypothetical protein CBD11_02820 [Phycisphaera sp. TMED151]|nr:MAG: hypothetical protein CBD11_02820 [Phycisphaera sp. TMED151]